LERIYRKYLTLAPYPFKLLHWLGILSWDIGTCAKPFFN
jgi:hypothetical protein